MRISELLTESEMLDEISRPRKSDAHQILINAGYKFIGSGMFADVYGKQGSDTVLKLVDTADKLYFKFVQLAKSNPNPHFPKFKGKLMRVTDGYYAIRIEKLTNPPLNLQMGGMPISRVKMASIMSNYIEMASDGMLKLINPKERDAYHPVNMMPWIEKYNPGITEACLLIAKNFRPRDIDLHLGNYMMRGNDIVIIDPVSGGSM